MYTCIHIHTHTQHEGGGGVHKQASHSFSSFFFIRFFFICKQNLTAKEFSSVTDAYNASAAATVRQFIWLSKWKKKKKYKKGGNRTATSIRTDCVWWRPNRWPGEFRGILRKNVDGWPSVATTHWQHTEFVFNPATTTTITATAATATDEPKK